MLNRFLNAAEFGGITHTQKRGYKEKKNQPNCSVAVMILELRMPF